MQRRSFLRSSAAAAGLTALSYSRVLGANNRVSLGFIGLGNRGDQVLEAFLEHGDSQIDALCDLRRDYMDYHYERTATRGERTRYQDYRKLLDKKGLDAVVISTPDHWHALMTIHACQAGHDVYVEKPLSLTIVEGRRMVEAVNKYKRVAQVGTHRRSLPWCADLARSCREGDIGQITAAEAFYVANDWPNGIGNPADSQPPAGVSWDQWRGPAPDEPYNVNKTFYKFRWFFPYSGGQITNMGVHYLDMIQWGLGQRAPKKIAAFGGVYAVNDNREVPDTAKVIWEYDDAVVSFDQINANGFAPPQEFHYRGTKGTLLVYSGGYEIKPDTIKEKGRFARTPLDRETERGWRAETKQMIEPKLVEKAPRGTEAHARNFLDCVKSREKCNADIETGHRSTSATLLANIALKTGEVLEWDAEREEITNHREANSLLYYEYRQGYELPTL